MESYVSLRALAESEGFLGVLADGVVNPSGYRFWNASGGCCDFSKQEVNDVAFFRELVTMLQAEYDAHPKRIHFFGYSNCGFMSYRLAGCYASRSSKSFAGHYQELKRLCLRSLSATVGA